VTLVSRMPRNILAMGYSTSQNIRNRTLIYHSFIVIVARIYHDAVALQENCSVNSIFVSWDYICHATPLGWRIGAVVYLEQSNRNYNIS
jgi:hypothetical protein